MANIVTNTNDNLDYGKKIKNDAELRSFLMGLKWAQLKSASEQAKILFMKGIERNTEADAKEQKLGGIMQQFSGMQDQFSEHLNNAPLPQINPMAGGLPPIGSMPPLPQQQVAPAF